MYEIKNVLAGWVDGVLSVITVYKNRKDGTFKAVLMKQDGKIYEQKLYSEREIAYMAAGYEDILQDGIRCDNESEE